MRFDPKRLHLEKVNAELRYHATYTFYGLKGVLAERWAHGPLFGAVGEVGSDQINLSPASGEGKDERLVAVAGLRASAVLAEGKHWAGQAQSVALDWLGDVYTVLKPQRTVALRVELFALYPIRDPNKASQRVRRRYYQDETLGGLAAARSYHAAAEVFVSDEAVHRTIVLGVVGPPHRGTYFTFPNESRDSRWWMGLRTVHGMSNDEGIHDPLGTLQEALGAAMDQYQRLARNEIAAVVE